jgi:2,5-furandicarboxylate decarboxylase 1
LEIRDLRSFIDVLESKGELIRIKEPVELAKAPAMMRESDKMDKPAPFFEKIVGYNVPLVSCLLSNMRRIALALGVERQQIIHKLTEYLDHPIKPKIVQDGPVKEVVVKKNIDLLKMFPIPVHAKKDSGPFVSSGVVVARDPETGRLNLSYNRMEVKGPTKLGIHIDPWRHLGDFYNVAESRGEALPIAVCIGLDPAIEIAAAAKVPFDEFELAGAIRGRPIELVKGESVDIEVPAHAEIVIEGRILPKIREPEGPFAEFMGYYGMHPAQPVFEITCITHRESPIYRTMLGASWEHIILGNVIYREPVLYKFVKHVVPTVKAVHLPPYASGLLALISIKKENEGTPKNAIFAALASHVNIKQVVVVDEDVDIFDPKDVWWAIATRTQADKDWLIMPRAFGHPLDKTSDRGVTTKVGIDATVPLARKAEFERVV